MAAPHSHHGSRPPLSSQQSSSVPSTPHHRARPDFTPSRSPSPSGLNGRISPRSVTSEANRSMPKIAKVGRPMCKYETSYAFSRRRMQYDIGDAPLETPKEEPKKSLDPEEDKKLSGDMRELYDRLLPSEDSKERRALLLKKLERILRKEFPGQDFNVVVFGSSGNMLYTNDSDVDICIQTGMKELESMHQLAAALDRNDMERVICVPAKVPIVKIWDPEYKFAADLNVNNPLALENTRMIKTYVELDPRVRPLAMIIKHWTKQRILNDAGVGGTISSYAWICLIINFLQTRKPPILPSLHQRAKKSGGSSETSFDDNIDAMANFGSKNKASLGQLLFEFYRYYGFEFKYDDLVVSVRQGRVLTRKEKGWASNSRDGQWKFCIEEPFNTSRNLGNSADSTAFRGIHLEIRRAFVHLAKLELDKMVEKYEFPPEEKSSSIFKRPPQTKAVLSAVPPNSNKGKGSMRFNRNGNRGGHSGASYRRASSSAIGRNNGPFSPMQMPSDFLSSDVLNGVQWVQNWQMLAQVNSHATAHAHSILQTSSTPRDMSSPNAGQLSRAYSAGPSPMIPFYPIFYQMPLEQTPPMTQSVSQDGGVRTNPSSPSLGTAVPARRGMQRASVSNGSPGGSIRSQSQPGARGPPQPTMMQVPVGYDMSGQPLYQSIPVAAEPYRYANATGASVPAMDNRQADYQAYMIQEQLRAYQAQAQAQAQAQGQMPPPPNPNAEVPLARVPSHPELAQRRERGHQPLILNSSKVSRSPSPGGGHGRHDSTGLRSAPATSSRFGQSHSISDHSASSSGNTIRPSRPPNGDGLLIVNGSNPPEHKTDDSHTYGSGIYGQAQIPDEFQNGYYNYADSAQNAANYEYMTTLPDGTAPIIPTTSSYPVQSLPATDPSSLSSPMQSFPAYVDPLMMHMATQEEEMVMSPKTAPLPYQSFNGPPMNMGTMAPPPPPTAASATNASTKPSNEKKEHSRSPGSKSISALSTVIETRTPSPSSNRKGSENNRPLTASQVAAKGSAMPPPPFIMNLPMRQMNNSQPEPVPPTPAGPHHQHRPSAPPQVQQIPNAATGSSPANANSSNQWQSQTTGKKKNRKRSKSGPTASKAASGNSGEATGVGRGGVVVAEPMPERMEDRKGG